MDRLTAWVKAAGIVSAAVSATSATGSSGLRDGKVSAPPRPWRVGTPIVTYYAGPAMTDAVARQMAEGGFNVVWCGADQLDLVGRYGLRGMVRDALLNPSTLDDPEKRDRLDQMIERVKRHPAMYSYYIIDEPAASTFPAFGRLTAYLRERDQSHMSYVNLFPTYATNEQLGTQGDVVTAYREYLRLLISLVNPMLLSWDNYQFLKGHDGSEYFLNLALIRQASLENHIPFLNIVQASSWNPEGVRVPTPDEMRYLVYTTAAYGAKGISYYVYYAPGHEGMLARADGTTTPLYDAVRPLNREFVALAEALAPYPSQGVYHTSLREPGCLPAPAQFPIHVEGGGQRGFLLGAFGKESDSRHGRLVMVVNLDYKNGVAARISGSRRLEVFDATTSKWSRLKGDEPDLQLPPGGGKLLRIQR